MKVNSQKTNGSAGADTLNATGKANKSKLYPAAMLDKSGSTQTTSGAKVNLSQRVLDMQKIKELATPSPDSIDEAKVARLQKLIDEGKYKIDADAIADRLVDDHLNIPS